MDHSRVIREESDLDQVFEFSFRCFSCLEPIQSPELLLHPVELLERGIILAVARDAAFFLGAELFLPDKEYFSGDLPPTGVLFDPPGFVDASVGFLDDMEMIDDHGDIRHLFGRRRQKHRFHVDTDLSDPGFHLGGNSPQKPPDRLLAITRKDRQRPTVTDIGYGVDHPSPTEALGIDAQRDPIVLRPEGPLRIQTSLKSSLRDPIADPLPIC